MPNLKNWTIEEQGHFCILTLDIPEKSQNVLSSTTIGELEQALDQIGNLSVHGLIIQSGKSTSFIAGADISEFQLLESEQQAYEKVQLANRVIHRIESLPFPTVAMINAHCMGGGLELALSCDYRVSTDSPSTRLGLPEVKLGIHPGFGGTVRLIGRTVNPYVAAKMGIVDLCVPDRQLKRAAFHIIEKKPPLQRAGKLKNVLNLTPFRYLMAQFLRKRVANQAKESHYPAPYAVIDLWKNHGGDREAMFLAEQKSISRLFTTDTSRNLVKVFFLQEGLKKTGRLNNTGDYQRVHVIGAGVMGGDIAAWCALRGLQVTIHDRSAEALAKATQRAHKLFREKLKKPRLVERAMDRYQQDLAGSGATRADVIIEAIFENADAKISVFSELEKVARPNAILATNTSSIPLETISTALHRPGRLVGLHFFNPVVKMQLIEIVAGTKTYAKTASRAAGFASRIGRLPVPVKSSPGFLVNRVLMPYTLEAVELLSEGITASVIDSVAKDFGMPMGPITLADTVGLDICLHVGENLTNSFGGVVPDLLKNKIAAGQLGKKSGQGFYTWEKGKPKIEKARPESGTQDIEDRLIFRYLNECVTCLHEGVVKSSTELDAALIFGTGFAPFRGGPINYITSQSPAAMLERIQKLQDRYGERFKPSDGWNEL
jgi:3-hydroxyacyl-CoA dehydrogenase/enoyl-CoA hydratase/3-hydroxybutyryl-CoA epimerase